MIEILRTDLQPVGHSLRSTRPTGLSGLNPRMDCTPDWQEIERIGLSSDEDGAVSVVHETGKIYYEYKHKYEKYSGKVLLKIRGRGIRDRIFFHGTRTHDRSIPENHRNKFRQEVYKSIKSWLPTCGEYFSLLLHYNCGVMNKLEIEDTTKL